MTHLLFDFFGTLVNYSASRTEQGYERSHQILLSSGLELGYAQFLEVWSETCRQYDLRAEVANDEYSMDDVVTSFLAEVRGEDGSPAMVCDFRDTYLEEWDKGVHHIPGVPQLLRQLAERYTIALVTNTHSADFVRDHLRRMCVAQTFSAIVTSVEHSKRKPSAAIFEHALKVTNGRSAQAIYIGDSFEADYIGATGVGMRCLLIDPQKVHDVPEHDRLSSVLDLEKLM